MRVSPAPSATTTPPAPRPTAPATEALRRLATWLIVVAGLDLLTLILHATMSSELIVALGPAWALSDLAWIGLAAALAGIRGAAWWSATIPLALCWLMWNASGTHMVLALTGPETAEALLPALRVVWGIATAVVALGVGLLGGLATRICAFAALALTAAAWLGQLAALPGPLRVVLFVGSFVSVLAVGVLLAVALRGRDERVAPAATRDAEWREALAGADKVRAGELTRVITALTVVLLGLVLMPIAKSPVLVYLLAVAALGGFVVATLLTLIGAARLRRVPVASGARGGAAAAYAFAWLGLGAALFEVAAFALATAGIDGPHRGAQYGRATASLLSLSFATALSWSIVAVGRWVGDRRLVTRALRVIATYLVVALAGLVAAHVELGRRNDWLQVLIAGLALLVALMAVLDLIGLLRQLRGAIETHVFVTPFDEAER